MSLHREIHSVVAYVKSLYIYKCKEYLHMAFYACLVSCLKQKNKTLAELHDFV